MSQKYFLLLILFTISCKGISQKYPRQNQNTKEIKEQVQSTLKLSSMEEQLIRDYYEIDDPEGIIVQPNDMQVKCTDLAVRLICQELIRSGFKPLSSEEAYKRVCRIFGVDLNKRSEELIQDGFWKYADEGNSKERSMQKNIMALKTVPGGQTFGIFWNLQTFVPQYNCIILSPSLGQVVTIKGTVKGVDGEEYMDTEKGKIIYSLDKSIFYRNQFIFHDSKAALTWLMNNDRNFLSDLFLEYGYDKSDVINKMMLDEIKVVNRIPEADETKALFASRCANGKLLIHRGLMEYMLKHVNEENEYFLMLDQYASTLLDLRNYPEFDGLTKEERYRIGAYVGYYYGLLFDKGIGTSIDINGFGHALCYDKDFRDYLKRNKYFHLPGFEDITGKHYRRYRIDVDIEIQKMRDE